MESLIHRGGLLSISAIYPSPMSDRPASLPPCLSPARPAIIPLSTPVLSPRPAHPRMGCQYLGRIVVSEDNGNVTVHLTFPVFKPAYQGVQGLHTSTERGGCKVAGNA